MISLLLSVWPQNGFTDELQVQPLESRTLWCEGYYNNIYRQHQKSGEPKLSKNEREEIKECLEDLIALARLYPDSTKRVTPVIEAFAGLNKKLAAFTKKPEVRKPKAPKKGKKKNKV
jgi:hypothetical protein